MQVYIFKNCIRFLPNLRMTIHTVSQQMSWRSNAAPPPPTPRLKKRPFWRERMEGKLLIGIKPLEFISFAQHLFWEMHRKPFTCGLAKRPECQLEADLQWEGRAMCAQLQSLETQRCARSLQAREASQEGTGPPTLLFLFPPARKGVGKVKMPEAQRET